MITIAGIQEAQAANNRVIANMQAAGAGGRAVQFVLAGMHRYAVSITHVWHEKGGALRASHRMKLAGLRGEVYIENNVNPRGGRTGEYGPIEHARGREHAFYDRTESEAGPALLERAASIVAAGIN